MLIHPWGPSSTPPSRRFAGFGTAAPDSVRRTGAQPAAGQGTRHHLTSVPPAHPDCA
jgi:hypothetical protein